MTDARTQAIAEFKAAIAKQEAQLALVPTGAFVIEWHESVLKTDGATVALFGPQIYSGKASMMIQEAAKFTRTAAATAGGVAVALPAKKALQRMQDRNAELLKMMGV